jgi:hypothetical protein
VREQGSDRLILLPPEFCSMSPHLRLSARICHRHSIAFADFSRILLLVFGAGVMNVITAADVAEGEHK